MEIRPQVDWEWITVLDYSTVWHKRLTLEGLPYQEAAHAIEQRQRHATSSV